MTDPIRPSGSIAEDRREAARRRGDPPANGPARPPETAAEPPAPTCLPAAVPAESRSKGGPAAFAAQVLGQEGQKRGLRGGLPVLRQARSTYLETEWSGPADRRPGAGRVKKADI